MTWSRQQRNLPQLHAVLLFLPTIKLPFLLLFQLGCSLVGSVILFVLSRFSWWPVVPTVYPRIQWKDFVPGRLYRVESKRPFHVGHSTRKRKTWVLQFHHHLHFCKADYQMTLRNVLAESKGLSKAGRILFSKLGCLLSERTFQRKLSVFDARIDEHARYRPTSTFLSLSLVVLLL